MDALKYFKAKNRMTDSCGIDCEKCLLRGICDFNLDVEANIDVLNIHAYNIYALDIEASIIIADNIRARNIVALDISYYAVCYATESIRCDSINGRRENAKHFVLDGKLEIEE